MPPSLFTRDGVSGGQRPDGTPVYMASGLYHVRLYWMGAWRRIPVDDHRAWDEQCVRAAERTGRMHARVCLCLNRAW